MSSILITGMSGTGKSTVIGILARRGHAVVETDDPGWCVPSDGDWSSHDREWLWDEARISTLLDEHENRHLFVSGCRPNQGSFYPRFDHVVVLRAPLDVMLHRISIRTNNAFGQSIAERKAIIRDTQDVEPLLIRSADLVLDTSILSPEETAERLEALF